MISAIILAAGLSSRMAIPKQLLTLGDKTLIRIVTENVLASAVDEVLVVTGHFEKEVSAVIKDLPVKVVYNPRYEQGQGTSLALGVQSMDEKASAFLVLMSDQPLITPSLINLAIEEFQKNNYMALRPTYHGLPGHPVVFCCSLRVELEVLKGDEGARQILKKLGDQVHYLPMQDKAVVFDVDTPEDFEQLKNQYKTMPMSLEYGTLFSGFTHKGE